MKLRFTPRALDDLVEIADYLKARSPSAVVSVRAAIYANLEQFLFFPRLGRRQQTAGVRKLVTRHYGYLVRHPARERDHEDD